MAKPNAYVLRLDKTRAQIFADALNETGLFAEAVPSFSHSRNVPLVCFVVGSQGRITHIASGRRGVNAGTRQSRLNVDNVEPLQTRQSAQKVINGVPARNRKVVADRFRNGGLLTPKAFDEVIDLIVRLAPETAKVIDRFTKTTRDRLSRLSGEAREALGQQKEAVATAMLLAGVDRSPLREWQLRDDSVPKSFLDGLPESRQREDEMIVRDLSMVPGTQPRAESGMAASGP